MASRRLSPRFAPPEAPPRPSSPRCPVATPDSPHSSLGPYGSTKEALDRYSEARAHEMAEYDVFVNALAPVVIVLTPGAEFVRDIALENPDMVEPVEMMAEATLEPYTGRHVAQLVFRRDLVHASGAKVHSLDGKQMLGDAFMQASI